MASNVKRPAGGAKGGDAALALPEGFSTAKNKFYADSVAPRFDTLPPDALVRVLLVAAKDTGPEKVKAILGNPRFQLRAKALGIYEANVKADDMERAIGPHVGADKTFRWVDLGTRFFGLPVESATDLATVAVSYDGPSADAKKKLKSLGLTLTEPKPPEGAEAGEWVNPDAGLLVGTISGAELYDLVLTPKATSIEVRSVEKAPAKK